jgi:hypothetical protein
MINDRCPLTFPFRRSLILTLLLLSVLAALFPEAQAQRRAIRQMFGRGYADEPVEYGAGRQGVPTWEPDANVPRDAFVFARVKYRSWTQQRSWNWYTDYRDSDLNMSYRLHQLTALRVDPEGTYVEITDPRLFDYPLLFMSGVGGLELDENEASILRRYMLNGGFIFVDDFHGHQQWDNFAACLKMVFPDREPEDIPLEHPVFHSIFDLKEKFQVPNIGIARRFNGQRTWEEADWKEVHYCALYDDKKRMMMFIGHNTDLGDAWEEEANDPFYFQMFSEPQAFPIGINVIVYAMTH